MKKKYVVFALCTIAFFSLLLLSKRFVPAISEVLESSVFSENIELKDATPAFLKKVENARVAIVSYLENEVGLREHTNQNDHKRIDEYFTKIGFKNIQNKPGNYKAWCGALQANAWLSAMDKIPWVKTPARLASVDGWRVEGKVARVDQSEAGIGDVVVFAAHRHVEGIYKIHPNPTFKYFTTIGGNTSAPDGETDTREGVHIKTRMWREMQAIISVKKTLQII